MTGWASIESDVDLMLMGFDPWGSNASVNFSLSTFNSAPYSLEQIDNFCFYLDDTSGYRWEAPWMFNDTEGQALTLTATAVTSTWPTWLIWDSKSNVWYQDKATVPGAVEDVTI